MNSSRKTEIDDLTHKWIGTYNTRHMVLSKFFRWLYNFYKNNESDQKKWITPPSMQGIKQLSRKEKSTYRPSDIWTDEDHALFLKYCPDKRYKCFHAITNDTSARPHELLNLKIKDIIFKISSTTGMQYAEVHITKSKTKPRTLPLIFSIPYIKDWIDSHPLANNPDAFLFISLADRNFGKNSVNTRYISSIHGSIRNRYFPNLIKILSIPEAEKIIYQKPADKTLDSIHSETLSFNCQILDIERTYFKRLCWMVHVLKNASSLYTLFWE